MKLLSLTELSCLALDCCTSTNPEAKNGGYSRRD